MKWRMMLAIITMPTLLSCVRHVDKDDLIGIWSGGTVSLEFLDRSSFIVYKQGYLIGTGNYKTSKKGAFDLEYQNSNGQLETWICTIEDELLVARISDGRGLHLSRRTAPIKERAYINTQAITRIAIDARVKWMDTRVELEVEQDVEIVASGEIAVREGINCKPDGCEEPSVLKMFNRISGYPHGSLIGKISGSDSVIYIGDNRRFKAFASGMLLLGVNDTSRGNNRGYFTVNIAVAMKQIELPASAYWQDTGIEMRPGKEVVIEVSGHINVTKKKICEAAGCSDFSLSSRKRYPDFPRGLVLV